MSIVNQISKILPRLSRISPNFKSNMFYSTKLLQPKLSLLRPISRTCAAYDGSGKTTVSFLNEDTTQLMVDGYSASGFTLNNRMKVFGPMVLFPNAVLSWRVQNIRDIHEDSLVLFQFLDPKPGIILIGYGDRSLTFDESAPREKETRKQNAAILAKVTITMRQKGLNVECLPTEDAIASYNYLCSEDRLVAAALIPPHKVRFISSDHEMTNAGLKSTKDRDMFTLSKDRDDD